MVYLYLYKYRYSFACVDGYSIFGSIIDFLKLLCLEFEVTVKHGCQGELCGPQASCFKKLPSSPR